MAAAAAAAPSSSSSSALYWDSFVLLFDELDAAPVSSDLPEPLVKKIKDNHAWFLDSVARFKPPSEESRRALDSGELSLGPNRVTVKKEIKDVALQASACLCLDQVQSYILVSRTFELNKFISDLDNQEILHQILLQYYLERQCLLKCLRCIFVHALYTSDGSSNDVIMVEALRLAKDGLEGKLLSILHDLLLSAPSERTEVGFVVSWIEESLIEDNLILDILFLFYYGDFCKCTVQQWKKLCLLFKGILSGSFNNGQLAVSIEARNSFVHAKAQLLLILIETLDLENLLHMVHDEVPFSQERYRFSLSDVQEIDALVSSFLDLGAVEAEPLILAWATSVCLLLSLPDGRQPSILMEIDHVGYVRQAFSGAPFSYLLQILCSATFRDSYGLVSGFVCILRTLVSAFIASYDLTHQGDDNILNGILGLVYEIYHGEESLSFQFWDRDSIVDGPIRSLLYMLEKEYPYNTVKLIRFLSALSDGKWAAECVFNFLDNMRGITLPVEISGSFSVAIETPHSLFIPGVEGLVVPSGTRGHCLKVMDENVMLVRWECEHSGIFLLLLELAQEPHPDNYEKVFLTLNLLHQMVSFSEALCFSLLNINKSVSVEAARKGGLIEKNVCIDVVKIVCSLVGYFVQDASNAGVVSICIKILAQMLTCAPSHVIDVVVRSNIFKMDIDSSSSGKWLLSGGLARMLLADCRENEGRFSLTTSVLDFTVHLVDTGAENDIVSALVGFSLQYVMVNHLSWISKLKYARWKVTLKVLEVMRTCVNTFRISDKRCTLFHDTLLHDSSIHNVLWQIICIRTQAMERSFATSHSEIKEVEDLLQAVRSALDIVYSLLAILPQGPISDIPLFVQTMLSSTKRTPVVSSVISLIYLSHNPDLQLSAFRLLSMLCCMAAKVQSYSVENVGIVVDASQVRNISRAIHTILEEGLSVHGDLVSVVFELLISAARYQPALLVYLLLAEEEVQAPLASSGIKNNLAMVAPAIHPLKHGTSCSTNSILHYLKKSEVLIKSSPDVLLSVLILLKALWEGGLQYVSIVEKLRSSDRFWETLSSVLATKAGTVMSVKDLESDQTDCKGYRFRCQGTVLEIMANELFLQEKLLQVNMPANLSSGSPRGMTEKRLITESPKTSNTHHLKVILSSWCGNSTLDNLIMSFTSGRYDNDVVLDAKLAVCLCVVHLASKLSSGDSGCLSSSLVEKIGIISSKLSEHPAFSTLLTQYAANRYREGKELTSLVLNDLYYQLQGQLEGREIAPGYFQELSHFLLELGIFQCKEYNHKRDIWPSRKDNHMFDIQWLRAEFRIDHWDYSDWKASKEVAERMFLHMDYANSVMFLTYSQSLALRALTAIIYLYEGNIPKTKQLIGCDISGPRIEWGIKYLCKHLQTIEDSIAPALNPPVELLELISAQVELLLVLSRILFSKHSHGTNARQLFSLSVLLIKTSGFSIKFLSDIRSATMVLESAIKRLLLLLLTSFEFCCPIVQAFDKSDLEVKLFAEASLTSMGLIPILCKYADNTEFSDLSVAALSLMLKVFLAPKTWLPILQKHIQMQLVIQKFQLKDSPVSILGVLSFLLTLANVKAGAEMLYDANIFTALKIIFTQLMSDYPFSGKLDEAIFSPALSIDESYGYQWGLGLAIITSMVNTLADDFSSSNIVDSAIWYFFSEKASIISSFLSAPEFPANDQGKKRARNPTAQTSLSSLRVTEQILILMCVLARHQTSLSKGTKEMDAKVRETIIHLLAFISRGNQHIGEPPNKPLSAFCPPTLKAEVDLNDKPSYVKSKHGWFTLSSWGNLTRTKVPNTSSVVIKDRPNGNGECERQTLFSDTVAIQMYRIALFVLKYLCLHAKAAIKRAEEVEFIDLAHFPELPMPEILHGLQDQAMKIVTELCETNSSKTMQPEIERLSLLLLQILEKSMYLELCVSQSYGMRPVFGRIEDFSKEFKLLVQAAEHHLKLKAFLGSLVAVTDVLYPGLWQTNSLF